MDAFDSVSLKSQSGRLNETPDKIYELIKKNEIGTDVTFVGPFGKRKCKNMIFLGITVTTACLYRLADVSQ